MKTVFRNMDRDWLLTASAPVATDDSTIRLHASEIENFRSMEGTMRFAIEGWD